MQRIFERGFRLVGDDGDRLWGAMFLRKMIGVIGCVGDDDIGGAVLQLMRRPAHRHFDVSVNRTGYPRPSTTNMHLRASAATRTAISMQSAPSTDIRLSGLVEPSWSGRQRRRSLRAASLNTKTIHHTPTPSPKKKP